MISGVKVWFTAAGSNHRGLGVIRHDYSRHSLEKLEGPAMGGAPGRKIYFGKAEQKYKVYLTYFFIKSKMQVMKN